MIAASVPVIRICLALFFSGAASLGFQIVWTRQSSAGIGHELSATLAMVTAFMGGLSIGALLALRFMNRFQKPKNFYAAIEVVIGAWGICSIWLMPYASDLARNWIGLAPSGFVYWLKAFAVSSLAVLPATTAMGATMVVAHRLIEAHTDKQRIGFIYALNTFGATIGSLAAAYLVLGYLGFPKTLILLSSFNLVSALLVWGLPQATEKKTSSSQREKSSKSPAKTRRAALLSPRNTLFATGFIGMGYEMLGVRVLSHSLENTIYTFASTLAIYLLGTAVGSAYYERSSRNKKNPSSSGWWFMAMSLSLLLGAGVLLASPSLYNWSRNTFGDSPLSVFASETLVAAAVFFVPTFCMGALFARLASEGLQQGNSSGSLFGINTLGSALAPILVGLILFPLIGSKWCLALLATGYLVLVPRWTFPVWGTLAAILIVSLALPSKLTKIDVPKGGSLLIDKEGAMAGVAVVETPDGHRVLKVNNRFQMGGTSAAVAEQRHADIPLLLHGRPTSALFLGLGTGITFATATNYPALKADGVELNTQVVESIPAFFKLPALPPTAFPDLRIFTGDARRFADQLPNKYSVIVADLFHPAQDGAGFLYTVEHYQTLKKRLADDGLICQWLPLYQMDEPTFRMITASFLKVFPDAEAWLLRFNVDTPVAGLISRPQGQKPTPTWVEQQLSSTAKPILQEHLRKVSLGDSVRLLGCLLADNQQLAAYASGTHLNTDNFPRVIFNAPSYAYRKDSKPYATLFALLEKFQSDPTSLLAPTPSSEASFSSRVTRFIQARDVYLKGLAQEMEKQVLPAVDAYIESARISEDFTLGYAQAITIAAALAEPNPKAARELLQRLAAAQPSRPVASEMLRRLEASAKEL